MFGVIDIYLIINSVEPVEWLNHFVDQFCSPAADVGVGNLRADTFNEGRKSAIHNHHDLLCKVDVESVQATMRLPVSWYSLFIFEMMSDVIAYLHYICPVL